MSGSSRARIFDWRNVAAIFRVRGWTAKSLARVTMSLLLRSRDYRSHTLKNWHPDEEGPCLTKFQWTFLSSCMLRANHLCGGGSGPGPGISGNGTNWRTASQRFRIDSAFAVIGSSADFCGADPQKLSARLADYFHIKANYHETDEKT